MNGIRFFKTATIVAAIVSAGLVSFANTAPAFADRVGDAQIVSNLAPQDVQARVTEANSALTKANENLERAKADILVANGYGENDLYQFADHPELNEGLQSAEAAVTKARADVKRANEFAAMYGVGNAAANYYFYQCGE